MDVSIDMTDAARSALSASMGGDEDTHVLLISAQSGGCSGYMYDMAIVEAPDASVSKLLKSIKSGYSYTTRIVSCSMELGSTTRTP